MPRVDKIFSLNLKKLVFRRSSGRFGTAEAETVIAYFWCKKTAVEGGGAEATAVGKAIKPGTAFQDAFFPAVFSSLDRIAGMRKVIAVHPFPNIAGHIE